MADHPSAPVVSVVLPTFRRPTLLRRAVDSVLSQTFSDWEMIVSDDEPEPGAAWEYLERLAASETRVRVTRNPGPHGQVGNFNHAIDQTRGRWIKPLYDDDFLEPDCLQWMVSAARHVPGVSMVCCRVSRRYPGGTERRERFPDHEVEVLEKGIATLLMYLQETGAVAPPAVLVDGPLVRGGVRMQQDPGINALVDSAWFSRLAAAGRVVHVNRILVNLWQAEPDSLTSNVVQSELDREFIALRSIQLGLIDPAHKPPSLSAVTSMLHLIRASHRLKRRRFREATELALRSGNPAGWYLAGRWLLGRAFPGRVRRRSAQIIQRLPVGDAAPEPRLPSEPIRESAPQRPSEPMHEPAAQK